MKKNLLMLTLLFTIFFTSCKAVPEKADYYGSYQLIKIRENGTILNIDTLARIDLTEELYVSSMDRNGDYELSEDEVAAVAYSFHVDEEKNPYVLINQDETPVYLEKQEHFDLLLKKIDGLGNETIMYLKK